MLSGCKTVGTFKMNLGVSMEPLSVCYAKALSYEARHPLFSEANGRNRAYILVTLNLYIDGNESAFNEMLPA